MQNLGFSALVHIFVYPQCLPNLQVGVFTANSMFCELQPENVSKRSV